MRPVETFLGMGREIMENDEGGEFHCDTMWELLLM
jgi:hypothetical protein